MKTNFTKIEFDIATSTSLLSCLCYNCNHPFNVMKKNITHELKHKRGRINFCSKKCYDLNQIAKINVFCKNCNKSFYKIKSQFILNNFCSQSCAATYNNTHKKHGTRKSKLEIWLETKLIKLNP